MRSKTAIALALVALAATTISVRAAAGIFGSWVECNTHVNGLCLDGTWWRSLPASSKQAVAEGMISSYIAGYRLAQFNDVSVWIDSYGSGSETSADKAFLARFRSEQNGIPVFNESPSAYAAAIDRFYERYPSKRTLEVAGVLRCLAAHAEFSCDVVGRSTLLPWPTGP